MLKHSGLKIQECYTATWRESKYTLIRMNQAHRLRRTGMKKVMEKLLKEHRVIETEIFGFDAVSSNSKAERTSLEDHPGYKLMVQKANSNPIELEWWINKGVKDLGSNRKGLLWRHIDSTDAKDMTRTQLIQRVEMWKPVVKEVEELKTTNAMLMERVRELEQAVRDEKTFNDNMLIQFANVARPLPSQEPSMQ
jgi:hypothetical protein